MKIVAGFAGYECEDIVLYLAKIWTASGKKVVIFDWTEKQSVFGICGFLSPEPVTEEYETILLTKEREMEAEVLLMVFGDSKRKEAKECQRLYLVTDETAFHAAQLAGFELGGQACGLLVRNVVPLKYGEAYLKLMTGQNIDRCYLLPPDERDMRERCLLSVDKKVSLKKLSGEMKELLCDIVCTLDSSITKKDVRKIQKKR